MTTGSDKKLSKGGEEMKKISLCVTVYEKK